MKITISLEQLRVILSKFGHEPRTIVEILNAVQAAEIIDEKAKHPNYKRFIGVYADFFKACKTAMPKLTKADGAAINKMIDTLLLQDFVSGDYVKALEAWTLLLTNAEKLNPFLRSQMLYPVSFGKYLPEIISKLRNINGQQTNSHAAKRDGNLGKYDR